MPFEGKLSVMKIFQYIENIYIENIGIFLLICFVLFMATYIKTNISIYGNILLYIYNQKCCCSRLESRSGIDVL